MNLENNILDLHKKGLNDAEIAKKLNQKHINICYIRRKLGLISNFKPKLSFDVEEFYKFYNQGLNDIQISKKLNCNYRAINNFRLSKSLPKNNKNNIFLTDFQKSVLIGTILGDTYLSLTCKNSFSGMFAHSLKQEDYFDYKFNILNNLCCKKLFKSNQDKRNNKIYNCVYTKFKSTTDLANFYNAFYKNRKKGLYGKEFIYEWFNEVSLAILIGDDGCNLNSGYSIATLCFNKEDLIWFQELLLIKFNINSTLRKDNILYIPSKSANIVSDILYKNLPESLHYKINSKFLNTLQGTVLDKSCELLETPEVDNQQPSFVEIH